MYLKDGTLHKYNQVISMILMESPISSNSICIEISSDDDSSNEDDASVGLGESVPMNLFEKFLHKSSLFGIRDDDVQKIRTAFQNSSSHFRSGDFVPFMYEALVRIKEDNAQQIMKEVDLCLCAEKINYLGPKMSTSLAAPLSPSQTKASPRKFANDLEDAKRKLVDFFNSHTNTKSGDQAQVNTVQNCVTSLNSSVVNGKCSVPTSIIHRNDDVGGRTGVYVQEICSLSDTREASNKPHHRGQYTHNHRIGNENSRIVNDTNQHTTTVSSPLSGIKNLSGPGEQHVNGDLENDTDCSKPGCDDEKCTDDDNDIVILSVIQKNKKADNPHSTFVNNASALTTTYNQRTDTSIVNEREHKKKLLIKSIKRRLNFYDKEIKKLMEAELTLDEMDSEDSSYIRESKLKDKYSRLYKKLCLLQGSSHPLNDSHYLRIKIEGCPYPEINREAERYIQLRKKFPDFFDIKNVVSNTNKVYKLGLKPQEEADIAGEVFSEIGNKLQTKRKKEFTKYSGSFLTDNAKNTDDPALNDHALKKKLKRNKKISKLNTEKLFKHYARLQYGGYGNDLSSNDEDAERIIFKRQRKVFPMKVEHCQTESIAPMEPDAPCDEILPNLKNEAMPLSSNSKETIIPKSTETLMEMDSSTQVFIVEKPNWTGNSCQPKYIGNPPCNNSAAERNNQEINLYKNCADMNCRSRDLSGFREGQQKVKSGVRKGSFDIYNCIEDAENKDSMRQGGELSASVIVIDSDDD